jgi:hypothetical protein
MPGHDGVLFERPALDKYRIDLSGRSVFGPLQIGFYLIAPARVL